jgi:DNA invertase Pin-like site-specific DNA recombinase
MRTALYARVSTSDQSTAMQLSALREYIDRRGWRLTEEYIDEGVSGSRERRPALDRLMIGAKRRAFDAVVVFRFDRFARSVSHLARALDEFRALGIEFVSLHEAVDTSTPMGRAMFHIAGAFAELEREIIRERVRAGLANAKRRGRKVGRPRALVNVQEVLRSACQGLSGRAIADSTGVSEATVRRILQSARGRFSTAGGDTIRAPGFESL